MEQKKDPILKGGAKSDEICPLHSKNLFLKLYNVSKQRLFTVCLCKDSIENSLQLLFSKRQVEVI